MKFGKYLGTDTGTVFLMPKKMTDAVPVISYIYLAIFGISACCSATIMISNLTSILKIIFDNFRNYQNW